MDDRVAVISIIVEDGDAVWALNELLQQYGQYIIGLLGLPYHKKDVNTICVAVDAPNDSNNVLTGALGRINGLDAKVTCSNLKKDNSAKNQMAATPLTPKPGFMRKKRCAPFCLHEAAVSCHGMRWFSYGRKPCT